MNITVVLADDHKIVRDGLRALIEKEPDLGVVAEADEGRSAVQMASELAPDVVVMDIGLPDMNGIEATRRIASCAPGTKVIGLSMHSDRRFVKGMLAAGAKGYLLKDCAFEELARAIRTVAADRVYLGPRIAGIVVEDYARDSPMSETPDPAALSRREREVLQLVAEGRTTKQIASLLKVSDKTVESHRQRLMDKLNLHSVADLTRYAVREGLASLDR